MGGTASFIILAEDHAGARFVETYLRRRGVTNHQIRTLDVPQGAGSGKQWVTQQFPLEAKAHRAKAAHAEKALLVCSDADELSVAHRKQQLEAALDTARTAKERIVLLVPKWEIETWAEHLLRNTAVDENAKMGWRPEQSRSECAAAGKLLAAHRNEPKPPPTCCPPSLVAADAEFERLA